MIKAILRTLLRLFYKVEVKGIEHLKQQSERNIIVANHSSYIDAVLLYAFLPQQTTFAINTHVANSWLGKIVSKFCDLFPMDPANPLSIRSLIRRAEQGGNVVIFPEGRITVTGTLMKIYNGPGLVAVRSKACVIPVRIDGAQYTPYSKMHGRLRLRWFPKITLDIQQPRTIEVDEKYRGRNRREKAGQQLTNIMNNMMFESSQQDHTLIERLLDARRIHGGKHIIAEDINRVPLSYNKLMTKAVVLGRKLASFTEQDENVGVLLPSTLACSVTFWGLKITDRIPAMLNFTVGYQGMLSACETAEIKQVITSKKFVEQAKLTEAVNQLSKHVEIVYLEDVAANITVFEKLSGLVISRSDRLIKRLADNNANKAAVVLFTSGSEGTPKGVVLSHKNLIANVEQLSSRIDFTTQDIALNALPLFHSFGLSAGMILPMTSGIRVFFYPSPLHYRIVPEIAYDINATILFGTNTFLSGYARFADAYDFYSLRYVFAGAEKLHDDVRKVWSDKFGVRILEGYGATETSPVISGNTPMANRAGTVGKLMPGMNYRLVSVPGLDQGQRLEVRGPNVMMGYLFNDNPGVLVPPATEAGEGWYDTGDIVTIDDDGFVTICGRAKRFAKIAGEMVSLTSVESLANTIWPNELHAAVTVPDQRKGEQVILLTTTDNARRAAIVEHAKANGVAELTIPRKVVAIDKMPVLGTGKIDYVSANQLVEAMA